MSTKKRRRRKPNNSGGKVYLTPSVSEYINQIRNLKGVLRGVGYFFTQGRCKSYLPLFRFSSFNYQNDCNDKAKSLSLHPLLIAPKVLGNKLCQSVGFKSWQTVCQINRWASDRQKLNCVNVLCSGMIRNVLLLLFFCFVLLRFLFYFSFDLKVCFCFS